MKEIEGYQIDGIDYGKIAKAFNGNAHFKERDTWENYFDEIITSLRTLRADIVAASQATATNLGRGKLVGGDVPTDIVWAMSIVLVMRTLAMLQSKAKDSIRDDSNRKVHGLFVERYVGLLQELARDKEEFAAIYPYNE